MKTKKYRRKKTSSAVAIEIHIFFCTLFHLIHIFPDPPHTFVYGGRFSCVVSFFVRFSSGLCGGEDVCGFVFLASSGGLFLEIVRFTVHRYSRVA